MAPLVLPLFMIACSGEVLRVLYQVVDLSLTGAAMFVQNGFDL
jgi:hypothetical protein